MATRVVTGGGLFVVLNVSINNIPFFVLSELVVCENLNLFAIKSRLCYSLSRYDDRCFFSATVFSLFLSRLPLLPESSLSAFRSFDFSCDFHARFNRERTLRYLFSRHPNVSGKLSSLKFPPIYMPNGHPFPGNHNLVH